MLLVDATGDGYKVRAVRTFSVTLRIKLTFPDLPVQEDISNASKFQRKQFAPIAESLSHREEDYAHIGAMDMCWGYTAPRKI